MSAGIEIYNTSNMLQITDKFRNLQFLGKGTLSAIDSDGITVSVKRYKKTATEINQ